MEPKPLQIYKLPSGRMSQELVEKIRGLNKHDTCWRNQFTLYKAPQMQK